MERFLRKSGSTAIQESTPKKHSSRNTIIYTSVTIFLIAAIWIGWIFLNQKQQALSGEKDRIVTTTKEEILPDTTKINHPLPQQPVAPLPNPKTNVTQSQPVTIHTETPKPAPSQLNTEETNKQKHE